MAHFICPKCKEVSEASGVCQTSDCSQNGEMLEECNCEDGEHAELLQKKSSFEEDLEAE